MELHYKNDGILVNAEVLDLLNESEFEMRRNKNKSKNVGYNLQKEVIKYLFDDNKPIALDIFRSAAKKLKNFHKKLSEKEITQLLNQKCQYAVELHLIFDNCDTRFTDNDIEEIIQILKPLTINR